MTKKQLDAERYRRALAITGKEATTSTTTYVAGILTMHEDDVRSLIASELREYANAGYPDGLNKKDHMLILHLAEFVENN